MKSLLTSAALGPLIIGAAVWCAAGEITVAHADSTTTRLAIPASIWTFVLATAAASLVGAWRRDFRLALPALLSTIPWWPLPLPPLALVFTGPLAWAPIFLALAVAIGAAPLRAAARATAVLSGDCRRAHWLAGVLTLVAALLVARSAAPRVLGGDEPHYLAITQSLLKDGDLRIENNHRDPVFTAANGVPRKPDYIVKGRDGQIYSIHAPGLPVVILPAFAAFGYHGAQAVVLLLAALTGALVWRLGWRVTQDTSAAWFAWAALAGSATFLFQSFTVFPDIPGALCVAAGLLLLLKLSDDPSGVGTRALVTASVCLAALPWLHTRFSVLAGVIGLLIAWRLLIDQSATATVRRARVLRFLAVPTVSAIAWLAYFQIIYGTPSPAAPYGDTSAPDGTHLRYAPGGLVALLFDEQFGLITYTPVLIAAFVGWWSAWRSGDARIRRAGMATLAIAVPYLVAVTSYWMWWAGNPAPPARFATAVLPVLAPVLAVAWARADASSRKALLALLAISLAITALITGVDHAGLAWNDRTAQARWLEWLGPVVSLSRGWPSFFWALTAAKVSTEIPFVLQVVVWIGLFALGWILTGAWLRRRDRADAPARLAIAWWLVASTLLAVQCGWWLTGVRGLDPATSQMSVLTASRGASVLEIGALRLQRRADPVRALTIHTKAPGVNVLQPPWFYLPSVPPGTYEVRFRMAKPAAGRVDIALGRSLRPLRSFDLLPLSEQSSVLALPAGALNFALTPEPGLRAAGGRADITPLELRPGDARARAATRFGSTDVFFLDDGVFVEAAGFWVRGGQAADVLLAAGPGQGAIGLLLQNGGAKNTVVLDAGSFHQTTSLQPSEVQTIDVPVPDSTGLTPLRITSAAGFRPSDVSPGSDDRRYLGVWIRPR